MCCIFIFDAAFGLRNIKSLRSWESLNPPVETAAAVIVADGVFKVSVYFIEVVVDVTAEINCVNYYCRKEEICRRQNRLSGGWGLTLSSAAVSM